MPVGSQELVSRAALAQRSNKLSEARDLCNQALSLDPANLQARLLLGICLAQLEESLAAIEELSKVATADRSSFQARMWLSMVLRKLGRSSEALKFAAEAVNLNSRDPQALNQLGLCQLDLHRYQEALNRFQEAVRLAPNVSVIHYGLGLAQQGLRASRDAIASFRTAARLAPNSLSVQKTIRQLLMDEYDAAGAADCSRAILRLEPESAEAHLWLVRALTEDNRKSEAQPHIERAEQLEPKSALALTLLGSIHQVNGDLEAAERDFRKSIELVPLQGPAYYSLATNRKMTATDRPMIDTMRTMVDDETLAGNHRIQLAYGAGKGLEDLGDYEKAMEMFEKANRLSRETRFDGQRFDREPMKGSYEMAMQIFNRSNLDRWGDLGSSSDLPIFVLGMMRSGTTLTEQILSSHPLVSAGGEQRFWSDHRNDGFSSEGPSIDPTKLKAIADQYLETLRRISDALHVVDKMPVNYEVIGLIHLAFPRAKIVHVRRNPVDNCISIYATANRTRLEWTHDKSDIVFVYRQYERLMSHWREVLPAGTMLEIDYEEIVSNRGETTRRLIDFCGLEWDEACMHPESNDRSVVTPSVWQVRQPVYRTSMDRWRRYEPWLGPFAELAR